MENIKWIKSMERVAHCTVHRGKFDLFYYTLFFDCIQNYREILKFEKLGKSILKPGEVSALIEKEGAKLFDSSKEEGRFSIFESGFIHIHKIGDHFMFSIYAYNKEQFEHFKQIIDLNVKEIEKAPKGKIFSLVADGNDLEIVPIGITKLPFEKDNYLEEVIHNLDHVTQDINSDNPCGKLTILDGEPGTGKTSLIRMLTDVINHPFVLVQSHNLINWAGPAIINLLLNNKDKFEWPLVFILEDADDCLVPRKEGNMNAISVLLNLSDGILGSVFDIRVIATTNANIEDLDPAILRYGRLCRRIKIGSLKPDQANRVYQRISGKEENPFIKEATLAEIYKYVKDPDEALIIKKNQTKRIGFTNYL